MSKSAKRPRQRQRKPSMEQIVWFDPSDVHSCQAMLTAARAAGCTCSPDIVVCDLDRRADVFHDDWCFLMRRGDVN